MLGVPIDNTHSIHFYTDGADEDYGYCKLSVDNNQIGLIFYRQRRQLPGSRFHDPRSFCLCPSPQHSQLPEA